MHLIFDRVRALHAHFDVPKEKHQQSLFFMGAIWFVTFNLVYFQQVKGRGVLEGFLLRSENLVCAASAASLKSVELSCYRLNQLLFA